MDASGVFILCLGRAKSFTSAVAGRQAGAATARKEGEGGGRPASERAGPAASGRWSPTTRPRPSIHPSASLV